MEQFNHFIKPHPKTWTRQTSSERSLTILFFENVLKNLSDDICHRVSEHPVHPLYTKLAGNLALKKFTSHMCINFHALFSNTQKDY